MIGRQLAQLLGHLPGGGHDRSPVVEHGLRAGGPHVVRGDRRVLVDELEVLGLHAQLVGGELAQSHHRAGAALLGAGDDLAGTITVDLDVGARRHREARPPADGHTDRLVVRQRLPVAGGGGGHLDALLQPDLAVGLPARSDGSGVDGVASAELDRVHPDGLGDLVGVRLERPAALRRGGRAHRTGRLVVRVREMGLDVDVRHLVGPGDVHRRQLGEEARVGRVGAVVDDDLRPSAGDRAVARDAGLDLDDHALAAAVGREELFLPAEDQLHRALGDSGERGDVRLVVEPALAPEPAAEVGHDDAHAVGRQF